MHPNPAFRQAPRARTLAFARARAFGVLAVNGEEGPLLAHVPFLLDGDGAAADLHLVRSTPLARALAEPRAAVLAASGPDGYLSPDWYGLEHQVPTWNYVAVHLRGRLSLLPPEARRPLLDRQSAFFEERLLPKPPWMVGKLPPEALERMMRQIVPARLEVLSVEGTWKLSQNKPAAARLGAAEALGGSPLGMGRDGLAALMREPGGG